MNKDIRELIEKIADLKWVATIVNLQWNTSYWARLEKEAETLEQLLDKYLNNLIKE